MRASFSIVILCALLACPRAFAVKSEWSTDHSFEDFVAGETKQIEVTQDGFLKLGPAVTKWVSFQDSTIWDLAPDGKGGFYVSVGNEGKIYSVDSGGNSKLLHQTKELNVYALAVDADGNLFAGGSPDGKIHRISKDGKAEVWFEPKQKYIWSLRFDGEGRLFAATGEKGILYRITGKAQGEVVFDSDEKHVRTLFFDSKKRLWAGSEPEGIVYRFDDPGKKSLEVRVIHESNFREVKAITGDDEGNVYAAIMGDGKGKAKTPQPPGGKELLEGLKDALQEGEAAALLGMGEGVVGGGEKPPRRAREATAEASELVRISPSDEVEHWGSDTEAMYALGPVPGGRVWVATADRAKFYEVNGKRQFTFLGQLQDAGEAVAMVMTSGKSGGAVMASSHPAALWQVSAAASKSGEFQSDVIDAQTFSRWGRLDAAGNTGGLQWWTRTGNTNEPDKSWSAWVETSDGKIQSRASRYLQYKLEMSSAKNYVEEVRVYYLPFNQRPSVVSVQINPPGIELAKMARPDMPLMLGGFGGSSQKSGKGAVSDLGALAGITGAAGGAMMPVRKPGFRSATWQARDPNNDTLSYDVFYRPAGDDSWKPLEKDLKDNFTSWDASTWPDGEYHLKVQASDAPSNSKGEEKTDKMISDVFLVDHTAPAVEGRDSGDSVKFTARDVSSVIVYAEISVDGKDWTPILSDDGILDEKEESFTVSTKDLKAGSHYVILRVKDQAENGASVTVKFKR